MMAVEELLAHYETALRELRAENEQLRRSALAFGELAERLNHALARAASSPLRPEADIESEHHGSRLYPSN
jgi:hypothetical protein